MIGIISYNFIKTLFLQKNICKFDTSKSEPNFYKNTIKSIAYQVNSYRFFSNFSNIRNHFCFFARNYKKEKNYMAIVLKKVTPIFNGILTTSDVYTIEDCTYNGIVDSEFVGKVKQIQKVIAIGAQVRSVSVGDLVYINFDKYTTPVQTKDSLKESMDEYYNSVKQYNIPSVIVDGKELLSIFDTDLVMIINEMVVEDSPVQHVVAEPEAVDVKSDIDIGFMPDIESKPLRLKKRK